MIQSNRIVDINRSHPIDTDLVVLLYDIICMICTLVKSCQRYISYGVSSPAVGCMHTLLMDGTYLCFAGQIDARTKEVLDRVDGLLRVLAQDKARKKKK